MGSLTPWEEWMGAVGKQGEVRGRVGGKIVVGM